MQSPVKIGGAGLAALGKCAASWPGLKVRLDAAGNGARPVS
jgi:hypothetical protein